MGVRIRCFLVLSVSVCLVSLVADLAAGQTSASTAQTSQDGLVRAELSLGLGRSAAVAFAPAAVSDVSGARIGSLQLDGAVRLGGLQLGKASTDSRYELRLERTREAWQLQVTNAESGSDVGRAALSHQQGGSVAPTFTVALFPIAENAARLVLRWKDQEAATELRFLSSVASRELNPRRPNEPVSRKHFDDVSGLARAQILTQNNQAALTFPDGRSVTAWYSRGTLPVDGPDFAQLASAADGTLIELTQSSVPSFKVDVPLRFGTSTLATANLAPGFHGSYGLWLKRVGSGWRLVFNEQPDVWGTQHDAEADAMEVELTYTQSGDFASRPFGAALVAAGKDRGHLVLHWGPHTWSAEFELVQASR